MAAFLMQTKLPQNTSASLLRHSCPDVGKQKGKTG